MRGRGEFVCTRKTKIIGFDSRVEPIETVNVFHCIPFLAKGYKQAGEMSADHQVVGSTSRLNEGSTHIVYLFLCGE